MANYNFAQGGDIHYNENMALYPQNAFIKGRPEFGWSTTLLKPAHHWEGGHYAPVRHINLNDECSACGLTAAGKKLVQGDSFLSHVIPSMSLLTDIHYVVHTPYEGSSLTLRLAGASTATDGPDGESGTSDDVPGAPVVVGTINTAVRGDGWFQISDGGLYVPSDTNEGIELVLTTWPEPETETVAVDPCGIFGPCTEKVPLCMTITAFYKHARAEAWCEAYCYDNCGC